MKTGKQILSWLLIIIQSCGIQFFSGQGTVLMLCIFALHYKQFGRIRKELPLIAFVAAFLLLNWIVNEQAELSRTIFQLGLVVEAFIFLKSNPVPYLYDALKLIFLHALTGYALYLIVPDFFSPVTLGYHYQTLFYLFYVADIGGIRNTGVLWEPGLLQLMLNLLLFLCIQQRKPFWWSALIIATIISIQSTAGFICLAVNIAYFALRSKGWKRWMIAATIAAIIPFSSFILANVQEKTSGINTSGLARYRDYLIGLRLIDEKPLLGHGLFRSTYLLAKPYVTQIESQLFTKEYVAQVQTLNGGYTNGLLGFVVWYGLPIALLIFFLTFRTGIIAGKFYERSIFFLLLCCTLISEPITYTAFFLIFPLSAFRTNKTTQ